VPGCTCDFRWALAEVEFHKPFVLSKYSSLTPNSGFHSGILRFRFLIRNDEDGFNHDCSSGITKRRFGQTVAIHGGQLVTDGREWARVFQKFRLKCFAAPRFVGH